MFTIPTLPKDVISLLAAVAVAIITSIIAPVITRKLFGKAGDNKANAEASEVLADTAVKLIEPLKQQIRLMQANVQDLQAETSLHKKEIARLNEMLAEAKTRETDLIQDNADLKTENEQLKRELVEAMSEIAKLRDRVAFLENRGKKR